MIVSIHQPAYLPWLGYLDRIAQSDVFIFLDTVQFEKNSYTNRNRIKTANGPAWLTVPVQHKGHTQATLATLEISTQQPWQTKHRRSLEQAYAKAPRFAELAPQLDQLWPQTPLLTELCFAQLQNWCRWLEIPTRLLRASALDVVGNKGDLVLNLCQAVGATRYLSGPFGRDYLDRDSFDAAGLDLRFHSFEHPVYPQLHGPFVPNMAVVDYWMMDATPFGDRRQR